MSLVSGDCGKRDSYWTAANCRLSGTIECSVQRSRHSNSVIRDTCIATGRCSYADVSSLARVQSDGDCTAGWLHQPAKRRKSICERDDGVPELSLAVKKAYAGTLHDPIVNVDITDFQKPFFIVSGQVGKLGQYELLL